ncbi:MAG: hypothetical protein FJ128_07325 [Deltaproteobacteria bacterium]|nr:hypothetical protein [Deltaproteobacteria bacterium]
MLPSARPVLCAGALVGSVLLLLVSVLPAAAEVKYETQNIVVIAPSQADLDDMARRLAPGGGGLRLLRFAGDRREAASAPNLGASLEGLLRDVARVLTLPTHNLPRLRIFLLPDGYQVRQRHLLFSQDPGRALLGYRPLEAFYEAGSRSIFLSLADLRRGIMAHELSHFLLCTALAAPPPQAVQEEWARYAETQID